MRELQVKRLSEFFNKHVAVTLVVPGLILYTLFLIVPILGTIALGLTKWEGINIASIRFIGFGNYIELARDRIFAKALLHNCLFVGVAGTLQFTISLFLALLLNQSFRFAGFFKVVVFIPQVLAFIGISFLFKFILAPPYAQGMLNNFLLIMGLREWVHAWLGDRNLVMFSIMAVHLWREIGFSTLLLLAGLSTIPESLYDASRIDGANGAQNLYYITLPLLREVNIVVVTLIVIYALRVFEYVFAMTGGGPNYASEVLATYIYRTAFEGGRMGYGSAAATIFFLIMTAFTLIYLKITKAGTMKL